MSVSKEALKKGIKDDKVLEEILAALTAQQKGKASRKSPTDSAVERIRSRRPTFADVVSFKYGGGSQLKEHVDRAQKLLDSEKQKAFGQHLSKCVGQTGVLEGYTNAKSKETLRMMEEVSGMFLRTKDGKERPLSREELGYAAKQKPRVFDVLKSIAVLMKVYASEALGARPEEDESVKKMRMLVASHQKKLDAFRKDYEVRERALKSKLSEAQRVLAAIRGAKSAPEREELLKEFLAEEGDVTVSSEAESESASDFSSDSA